MSKAEVSNVLSVIERRNLKDLENVIESGVESFLATGSALKKIREQRLYREKFKSFDAYVRDKWGFERNYANKLIGACEVKEKVGTSGTHIPKAAEITKERQLRELKNVPDESLAEVIAKAAEIAGDEPITSSDIKKAREQVLEPEDPELPEWFEESEEPEDSEVSAFEDVEPASEEVGPLQCVPWFKDHQVRKAKCKEVLSAAKLFTMMQKQHFSGRTGLPQMLDAMAEANGGKGDQFEIADASLDSFLRATKLMGDGKK